MSVTSKILGRATKALINGRKMEKVVRAYHGSNRWLPVMVLSGRKKNRSLNRALSWAIISARQDLMTPLGKQVAVDLTGSAVRRVSVSSCASSLKTTTAAVVVWCARVTGDCDI